MKYEIFIFYTLVVKQALACGRTGGGGATDRACTDLGGSCQDDSNKCSGSYMSNKCAGEPPRRCCTITPIERDSLFCSAQEVKMIPRDSWGARRPKSTSTLTSLVNKVYIHHTDTQRCLTFSKCVETVKDIQNNHTDNADTGYDDIGFNFLIGDDGKVFVGRGWSRSSQYSNGTSVAFIGSFENEIPCPLALNTLTRLLQCGVDKGKLDAGYTIGGHRDIDSQTTCPGEALYNHIKTWPNYQP